MHTQKLCVCVCVSIILSLCLPDRTIFFSLSLSLSLSLMCIAVRLSAMDEETATAYYDEMRRKGGGAAKLKQGLGYAASSSPPPQASTHPSFRSFVKGDDHAESLAKHEKESRLAVVRDKLKKLPVDADGHCPRSQSRDREQTSKKEHGRGHLAKGRHHSRSQDRNHTSRSERRRRHRRHESRSSSSRSRERRSWSSSSSGDSNYRKSGWHSRERNIDKRENRKGESLRARRTSRSPKQSFRRSRSASPRAHTSDNHRHSHRDSSKSLHLNCRGHSPHVERQRKSEVREEDTRNVKKPNACDYSKLIAGYDNMTPAEKVKEKMKLQLSETVSKDTARGMDTEWERFAFNKNAPLDDDAKLDYFGDGTGAHDDTGFLQNTGSTFLSTCSQAKREAQIQAAHDAAIFGPLTGMSSKKTGSYGQEYSDSPTKETTTDDDAVVQSEAPPPINNLLSDQVLTFQQGSWRERALKLKQQRVGSTIT